MKIIREQTKELDQYSFNPHPDIPRRKSLPPNAGTKKAMQLMQSHSLQHDSSAFGGAEPESTSSLLTDSWGPGPLEAPTKASATGKQKQTASSSGRGTGSRAYMPRDVFSQYSCQPGASDLASFGLTLTQSPPPGSIGFEQEKYADYVSLKASGTLGAWRLKKTTVKL